MPGPLPRVMHPTGDRRRAREALLSVECAAVAALLALLPFARGVLRGQSLYFRDLALYFFPLRRFVIEGLRDLELRFWNPYLHGGAPLALPPVAYPFDLLQILAVDEWGLSLSLVLHFPLAAVAFFTLARSLGLARLAAVGGAVVYSLGGFALSTVNLYLYLQALAWAPLVIWALVRASRGTSREVAVAAVLVGISISTLGVEVVAQTLGIGTLLALPSRNKGAAAGRMAVSIALGVGLAALPLLTLAGVVAGSARDAGFPTEVALAHAVHPMTLLQVVVGGLYGDPYRLADRFWGQNFFPLGFPYFLSLYLGATTLAIAFVGALQPGPLRWRLLAILSLALVICLGPWAGLGPLVEAMPALRRLRYPSKAFFSVHSSIALLAAIGLDALIRTQRGRGWRALATVMASLATVLIAARALPGFMEEATGWLLLHFFPADAPTPMRWSALQFILADATAGGLVALAGAIIAALAAWGRIRHPLAAATLVALVTADLLRTGAGLNPTVSSDFFENSVETRQWADSVRGSGRIFTCDVAQSQSYLQLRGQRPDHETWSFALLADSLTPFFNVKVRLPSALSPDLTMLVEVSRVSSPDEASCRDLNPLVARLRAAGVAHVLSVDPLYGSDLTPSGDISTARVAPAIIHTYSLPGARPLVEMDFGTSSHPDEKPGHLRFRAHAAVPTLVRVNVTPHPGWAAQVDGLDFPLAPSSDGRLGLRLPPGEHQVDLRFHAPGLILGLATSVGSLFAIAVAWQLGRRQARSRGPHGPHLSVDS